MLLDTENSVSAMHLSESRELNHSAHRSLLGHKRLASRSRGTEERRKPLYTNNEIDQVVFGSAVPTIGSFKSQKKLVFDKKEKPAQPVVLNRPQIVQNKD